MCVYKSSLLFVKIVVKVCYYNVYVFIHITV